MSILAKLCLLVLLSGIVLGDKSHARAWNSLKDSVVEGKHNHEKRFGCTCEEGPFCAFGSSTGETCPEIGDVCCPA
ncbi:hypothetical protein OS493_002308 [Desmophyllum pertusum]|uniref:Uncharacterized protein n=1 Tax=Desmophyllum pertusum TaxID=174260 RepID=A0A9W9YVU5_9CNID|nr:hypothetical protein OS493_002308 [Desmophyllum pertusum]